MLVLRAGKADVKQQLTARFIGCFTQLQLGSRNLVVRLPSTAVTAPQSPTTRPLEEGSSLPIFKSQVLIKKNTGLREGLCSAVKGPATGFGSRGILVKT